jgi:outer membrane protein assembly factor BamB
MQTNVFRIASLLKVWQHKLGNLDAVRLGFANGCVFALADSVACIDYRTGDLRWELEGSYDTLVVEGGLVFVGEEGSNVRCHSAHDGTLLWEVDRCRSSRTSDHAHRNPVVHAGV